MTWRRLCTRARRCLAARRGSLGAASVAGRSRDRPRRVSSRRPCPCPIQQLVARLCVYHIGDEALRTAEMAGRVPDFDATAEDFSAYSRRLQQYFVSNDVSDDVKKRAVFLCAIGAKTFGLLEDLIAPASVEEKSYEQLVSVLKQHFEPGTSAIVARFRFHTCVRGETESVSNFLARL